MGRFLLALSLSLFGPLPALAQITGGFGQMTGRYEGLYGEPIEVELEDVASSGFSYQRKQVRTRGNLDMLEASGQYYRLSEGGYQVMIIPVHEAYDAVRSLLGREVEVVGIVRELPERQAVLQCGPESKCNDPELPALPDARMEWPRVSITVWKISDLTEFAKKRQEEALAVSLEALVSKPGDRDGQTVRVVGKFRGRNLYGDLPARSQRASSDWVIKDDLYAVWVTGKRPKGSGWALDAGLKRDTGKWIEVVGRPYTRGGVTYLRALNVALASAPSPTAQVQAPPPPPERPKVPPVVVFSLPLDGDPEVPRDGRFVVQFSKDMDEESFKGRIMLRYVGPRLPGDREFDGVKLTYDRGRRALTVDPGDLLRPGRQVELLLLPGIADVDGLVLTPRSGQEAAEAVDVLRYWIGT